MSTVQASGIAAGAGAMVCVGGSVAVSGVLVSAPFYTAEGARYAVACALLIGFAWLTRRRLVLPRGSEWLWLCGVACTGLLAFNVALVQGSRHAEPAVLGVAVASVPSLLAVLGPLIEGTSPRPRAVGAAVVVTAGAGLVQGLGRTDATGVGYAIVVFGSECAFTLLAVPVLPRHGPVGVSVHATWLAGVMFTGIGLVREGPVALAHLDVREWLATGYLAVAVTAVAFVLWYTCVGRIGASRAGLLTGVAPVAAGMTGVLLGAPAPHPLVWAGIAVVAIGLALGLREKSDQTPQPGASLPPDTTSPHPAPPGSVPLSPDTVSPHPALPGSAPFPMPDISGNVRITRGRKEPRGTLGAGLRLLFFRRALFFQVVQRTAVHKMVISRQIGCRQRRRKASYRINSGQGGEREGSSRGQPVVLGFLNVVRLAGPPSIAFCHDITAFVGADRRHRLGQPYRAVIQPVRQDHQVGREPVAADMRGLPGLPRVTGSQFLSERAAEPRTARVPLRVSAHQVHRLGRRLPGSAVLPPGQRDHVEVRWHVKTPQPRSAARRPAREHRATAKLSPVSRTTDHLHPHAVLDGLIHHTTQRGGQRGLGGFRRPGPGMLDEQPCPRPLGSRSRRYQRPVM
ncbi:MAG: DMT family transporter [Streptosporangiaceae bacterium]|nr:DMT family transporter [Streptosporangiaceae bacterium]